MSFSTLEDSNDFDRNAVGMSVCKNMVEQMAGLVRVTQTTSKGTSLIVSFKTMCKLPPNVIETLPNLSTSQSAEGSEEN